MAMPPFLALQAEGSGIEGRRVSCRAKASPDGRPPPPPLPSSHTLRALAQRTHSARDAALATAPGPCARAAESAMAVPWPLAHAALVAEALPPLLASARALALALACSLRPASGEGGGEAGRRCGQLPAGGGEGVRRRVRCRTGGRTAIARPRRHTHRHCHENRRRRTSVDALVAVGVAASAVVGLAHVAVAARVVHAGVHQAGHGRGAVGAACGAGWGAEGRAEAAAVETRSRGGQKAPAAMPCAPPARCSLPSPPGGNDTQSQPQIQLTQGHSGKERQAGQQHGAARQHGVRGGGARWPAGGCWGRQESAAGRLLGAGCWGGGGEEWVPGRRGERPFIAQTQAGTGSCRHRPAGRLRSAFVHPLLPAPGCSQLLLPFLSLSPACSPGCPVPLQHPAPPSSSSWAKGCMCSPGQDDATW